MLKVAECSRWPYDVTGADGNFLCLVGQERRELCGWWFRWTDAPLPNRVRVSSEHISHY